MQSKPFAQDSAISNLLGFIAHDSWLVLSLYLREISEKLDMVFLAGGCEYTQAVSEHVVGLLSPYVAVKNLENLVVLTVDDLRDKVVQVLFWQVSLEDVLHKSFNFMGCVVVIDLDVIVMAVESVVRENPSLVERFVFFVGDLGDLLNVRLDHVDKRADIASLLNSIEEIWSEEEVTVDLWSWLSIDWDNNWTSKNAISI